MAWSKNLTGSIVTLLLAYSTAGFAATNKLTPPNHPKPHRYYVCYKTISYEPQTPSSSYYDYHYHGCLITSLPCAYKGGAHNQQFGRYQTYLLALNGYFMCAYS